MTTNSNIITNNNNNSICPKCESDIDSSSNDSNSSNSKRKRNECKHFQEFKLSEDVDFVNTMNVIVRYLMVCKSGMIETSRLPLPSCRECGSFNGRIHCCLQCVYAGCWKHQHIIKHFNEANHCLAIDSSLYQIYCHHCSDYIYDDQYTEILDSLIQSQTITIQELANPINNRAKYHSWKPTPEDTAIIQNNSNINNSTMLGLRGLNNLGNTCFMNVILQSFIHNPILRNYFLSDMHSNSKCEKRREKEMNRSSGGNSSNDNSSDSESSSSVSTPTSTNGSGNGNCSNSGSSSSNNGNGSTICLGCEMDILFTQVFTGLKNPYTPHHFLYSCWNYSNYLASYEQQDAHEFLISSLNGIHQHIGGTHGKDCNCIVHCTFGGLLRSEVKCTTCQFTSSTTDPFTDISLDIPKSSHHHGSHHNEHDSNNNNNNNNSSNNHNSLEACLERFTQPEKLDEKYFCRQCNSKQESTKQLTFNTLPVVICFHLKRFEQSKTHRRTHKIDTFIEFPPVIDMSPYTSSTHKKNENQNNNQNEENQDSKLPNDESFIYELFAVVNHTGKMDGGHYTCFVKHNDRWFKCDDSMITFSSIQKKQLEYRKSSATLTTVID
ncbi:hypothetical protein PPL_12256 [Heterostelium album PN500]|uniref:Ubiquitin carboxyl-terminal hydrolase n=1 Tax=Heterostelium pallidum (strain ATCC 26659 / Pp 5 / PN500) TaxID=670386 RepID=D3BM48_HETP5|nr:hypothetical protein PPL_12256 [Heterostelium album PN500]EFA77649.1 hypothetical protein PPL_12256 [Heterostelium album PN500]|eukprot:XP_020429777.1 hypothetical protein PPL_12256 [Heterostelium album PN500]